MLTFVLGLAIFPVVKWILSKRVPYMSRPILSDEAVDELVENVKQTINYAETSKERQSEDRLALFKCCPLFKAHRLTLSQASRIQGLFGFISETKQFRKMVRYPLLLQEHIEAKNELHQQRETEKLLNA